MGSIALEESARRMAEPLEHRGPDAGGVWTDAEAGVGMGHRRLSIIDLSSTGAQPMVSASGRFVISYNGEIYNAGELRKELERRGTVFRGRSDTEVVLEACAAWGVKTAVRRVIGMFAFAVWDRVDRSFHLVRDRLGIKPLYYCASPDRFLFASEITALRAHPNFSGTIDQDAIGAFMRLDYIPAPFTIFREVRKLRPGRILRVDLASLAEPRSEAYWSLHEAMRAGLEDRFKGTVEEAAEGLERLLADAVGRRMVSDVPLGAFLSGGIDSSTVVALMQRQSTRPVKTFSIGFREEKFNEAPHARAVAEHLGTDHCEHYIHRREIREAGPEIMAGHDEPFADPSLLPTALLSRLARREVTVALSGDGGDEAFGGYDRHRMVGNILGHPAFGYPLAAKALIRFAMPVLPPFLRTRTQALPGMRCADSVRLSSRELKMLARCIGRPEAVHYCLAHGSIRYSSGRLTGSRLAIESVRGWLAECAALSAVERQQYIDASGYLPDDILTKVDRASMGTSLEVRVPVLDHRVIEFAFRLPPGLKTGAAESKRILRRVLGRHVPERLFNRPKQGFGAPVRRWMEGPLREWALDLMRSGFAVQQGALPARDARWTMRRLQAGYCRSADFRRIALAAWCERHL